MLLITCMLILPEHARSDTFGGFEGIRIYVYVAVSHPKVPWYTVYVGVVPRSQDASGKWRFRLGSPTKNGIYNPGGYWNPGREDNPRYTYYVFDVLRFYSCTIAKIQWEPSWFFDHHKWTPSQTLHPNISSMSFPTQKLDEFGGFICVFSRGCHPMLIHKTDVFSQKKLMLRRCIDKKYKTVSPNG